MVYKKIMTDRNRNMTKRISTYLKSGGRVFVVVGAGHMVGDEGIIELLRKEGYRVDQL
ncbi:MAG: TraB/GumN family protein [Syntrophorhabdaceae bacterium]|nr:TraB/GumN family protein [Syntrophorhabdaceae bacterium]